MLQAIFDKSELEEMIESACVYDDIDAKLQKTMVETHSRLSNNAIDYFSIVMEKYNIRQIKNPQKIEGFCLVKDPPSNIVNTNEKILKSGGPHEFVYKTGIPAFRGIVYDKQTGKFAVINTCPGAGSCVVICYARHGRYVQYPATYDSMTRRLNYLLNHPEKYEEQLYSELKEKCKDHEAYEGYKPKVILRWNDSGHFFSNKYKKIADDVVFRLKKEGFNIESYAYTKVADVAMNAKFGGTTFSSGSNTKEAGKVDFQKHKTSIVVPKELFKGLDLMKLSDEQKLKFIVAKKFVLPIEKVITYGELMSTPKGEKPEWHVIVTPGDGDDAAFRKDVKTILLTQH